MDDMPECARKALAEREQEILWGGPVPGRILEQRSKEYMQGVTSYMVNGTMENGRLVEQWTNPYAEGTVEHREWKEGYERFG